MRRRALPSVAATLMVLAWSVLISTPSSAAGTPVIVEMTDLGFSPATVTIPPDTTITWVNGGSGPHGVAGEPGVPLQSPLLEPRFSYSYTFHSTGSFAYHDSNNSAARGTVLVVAGAPVPPPSAPPAPAPPIPTPPTPIPQGPSYSADSGDDVDVGGALPAGGTQPAPSAERSSQESADGASGTGAAQAPPLASVAIQMGSEWFGDPSFQGGAFETTISEGGTLEWSVQDGLHNIYECGDNWSDAASSCGAAGWHSDQVVTAGGTFSRTFDTPGTFYYLCTIHPATMRGIVTVQPAEDTADDPTPTLAPSPASGQSPSPTVAELAGIPKGGGALGSGGDGRTIMILIGAAAAFVISTVGFIVGGGARA